MEDPQTQSLNISQQTQALNLSFGEEQQMFHFHSQENNSQIFQFQGLTLPVITPVPGIPLQEVPMQNDPCAQQFTFYPEQPESSEEGKEEDAEKCGEANVKTRDASVKKTKRSWFSCA